MPENGPETQGGLTRRQVIKGGLLLAGGITAELALLKYGDNIFPAGQESNSEDQETYLQVQGGEIVDEEQLVDLLNEAEKSDKPVTADPTILRSTVYSVMRYHGLPEDLALKTADRIYIGELPHEDGLAGLDKDGFFIVLNATNFDDPEAEHETHANLSWSSLIHLASHEATHVSAYARSENAVEDYGSLGKAYLTGATHGFGSNGETYEGPFNFIYPAVPGGLLPNTIEEWTAEAGRINFIRHLGEKGLAGEYTASVETSRLSCRCHAFLEPSIRQVYDSSQPKVLGSEFSPAWLLDRHTESRRASVFLSLGEGILEQNPATDIESHQESSVRGLGMLGFSAFVYERGPIIPGTLRFLRETAVDDEELLRLAQGHQSFLNRLYGVDIGQEL